MLNRAQGSQLPRQSTGEVCYRDNLVFIVGIPRSGTTWVLSILEHHPDCLALTPAMLKISVQNPTKETGLLVRGFSDTEIIDKISQLPEDKLLVEKTPSHLLELDRIRTLFPRSKIVLIRRDPLDVIYSMLQAYSFWEESPKKLSEAVALYKKFADAQDAFTDYGYVIEYEKLVEDPVREAGRLFEHLNLRRDLTSSIVKKTKRGRSLPAELKGVFRKGTPGEGLQNFTSAELNFIRRQLGAKSKRPATRSRRSSTRRNGRMRVLITNHLLRSYTGSEIFTYTIADFLRSRGVEVVAYSKYVGLIRSDFEAIDVPVVEDLEQIQVDEFDVAHVHHNINALEIRQRFARLPIVFLSHGVLPFLEQPPCIDIAISKFLAVSEEVKENLLEKGVAQNDIEIFRNIVDSGKFCPTGVINPEPRKALILSYKIDAEKENIIRRACDKLGVNCKFVGGRFGEVAQALIPRYINDADIVFSVGRGVLETMFCGRVPLVFDALGGDGLVTPAGVAEIMKCNFSGRRYAAHYTVDELVAEIRKYRAEYGEELREIALELFDAERRIDALISVYDRHKNDCVSELDDVRSGRLDAFVDSIRETRKLTGDHLGDQFQKQLDKLRNSGSQPDGVQRYIQESKSLIDQSHYQEAKDILNRVLENEPRCVDALNNLAAVEILESRFDEAVGLLKKALKLDPRNEAALQNLEYLRRQMSAGPVGADDTSEPEAVPRATTDGVHRVGKDCKPVRLIAFYLPQFHPIPENDQWWGKGFTDWDNVAKARPLFAEHYQPHVPGELGAYDLRLPETRKAHAELARQYGIEGFCYWHYWFDGKLLLETPFNKVLESGKPDFPFCLAWANENWTRRWDGRDDEVLQEQTYGGDEDDEAHFQWLLRAFNDPRYMKVDNKPLFLVYNPGHLRDSDATVSLWRKLAESAGLAGLFLVAIKSHRESRGIDWFVRGFDAELAFQPDWVKLDRYVTVRKRQSDNRPDVSAIAGYDEVWPVLASGAHNGDNRFSCVMPSWDNTPRRGKGGASVLRDATPEAYEQWLRLEIGRASRRSPERRFVFINAWNEWAEGNHLEPDVRFGRAYLQATKRALSHSPTDREMGGRLAELATAAMREGWLEDAERDFEQALDYQPDSVEVRREYALLLQSQGKTGEAIAHFEQCLAVDENDLAVLKNLGGAYLAVGRAQDAVKAYQKVLSQDPQDVETLLVLGQICDRVGRNEKADFFYTRVLEVDPANAAAKQNLIRLGGTGPDTSANVLAQDTGRVGIDLTAHDDDDARDSAVLETVVDVATLSSHEEYKRFMTRMQAEYAARARHERDSMVSTDSFTVRGYCYPCKRAVDFLVDYQAASMIGGVVTPHWRERMVCPACGLNGRMRACSHLFEQLLAPPKEASVYAVEQISPLHKWLASNYPNVVGSEYLGETVPFGRTDGRGIRNESLTGLTFADHEFDYVLCFDVFEHIPHFLEGFRECLRVLKPGGTLFFTVPFGPHLETNTALAVIQGSDEIVYLTRPVRHIDPLNPDGCVAFHHFGWELLNQLREIGFLDVNAHLYWSKDCGYWGRDHVVFTANKHRG